MCFGTHGSTAQPAFLLYFIVPLIHAAFCLKPSKKHFLGSITDHSSQVFIRHLGIHYKLWKMAILLLTLANKVFFQQFLYHFHLQRLPVNLPAQPVSIRTRLSCFPLFTSTHCSSPRLLSAFMKALGILFEPTRIGNERAEHSWSSPSPSPTTIPPLQCTLV